MAYVIADIGSNHDGDLNRAKALIKLAADCGCNAAKFQYFKADTLINKKAFKGIKAAHQKEWPDVYDVYKKYETPYEWTEELAAECKKHKIDFMITPYDYEALELAGKYSNMIKIGSGDINYFELLDKAAEYKKPVIISTGASSLEEVITAVNIVQRKNPMVILMQCNTNYENKKENELSSNINVLKSFKLYFPNIALGLSDHTKSSKSVMAAICLGAEFIEKHLTDGKSKSPDNDFALTGNEMKYMISECNEITKLLGNNFKQIEKNEFESRIIQRRCWTAAKNIQGGTVIKREDIIALRPALVGSIYPIINIVGKTATKNIKIGDIIAGDCIK